ncbi:hypothetical protein COLO4_06048 [Corchorus olitorius]|uniref:Endonuclease/exonuclease/phosphatase n=1 Tax=Corchorus olitorius TaxID=93759 RepID=A0A1R3KPC7_9ROSI|nr:hypothetical protein COLO4_06048 [Corchorus olitorius]
MDPCNPPPISNSPAPTHLSPLLPPNNSLPHYEPLSDPTTITFTNFLSRFLSAFPTTTEHLGTTNPNSTTCRITDLPSPTATPSTPSPSTQLPQQHSSTDPTKTTSSHASSPSTPPIPFSTTGEDSLYDLNTTHLALYQFKSPPINKRSMHEPIFHESGSASRPTSGIASEIFVPQYTDQMICILAWNCRGAGRPHLLPELRQLMQMHCLHILIIMETRISDARAEHISSQLPLKGRAVAASMGRADRIWMLWNDDLIQLRAFTIFPRVITAEFTALHEAEDFHISTLYNHP